MQEKMWAYLIHLGSNMWDDRYAQNPAVPFPAIPKYREELLAQKDVWTKVTNFLAEAGLNTLVIDLGEGVQYDSHPELGAKGAWTVAELRAELDRLRAMGITPIPKLNFSCCHDAWLGEYRLMRCTETYYRVCRDLIDEVCEIFGRPALFHIGMDEENLKNQVHMGTITIRNELQWWKDFYYLVECCERNGARAWIWSDYYWDHPDIFIKRMPKSVLQSNWYYASVPQKGEDGVYPNPRVQAYVDFEKMGYDQVPTGSCWGYFGNMEQTVKMIAEERFDPERLKGFMIAPWLFTVEENYFGLLDNAHRLGLLRKEYEGKLG